MAKIEKADHHLKFGKHCTDMYLTLNLEWMIT